MSEAEDGLPRAAPSGENPRRRWYQFSLRTLMVVVTVAAGALLAWRTYVEPYRRQRETMALIKELGGTSEARPWVRRLRDGFSVQVESGAVPGEYLVGLRAPRGSAGDISAVPYALRRCTVALAVSDTRVTDESLARIRDFEGLTWLDLARTEVGNEGLAHLPKLARLAELYLDGTQVSDAGLDHLATMRQLNVLWLDRTRVTRAGMDRLGRALPGCKLFPVADEAAP